MRSSGGVAGASTPVGKVGAAVARWLAAGHLADGAPLTVACSGGADSLALALGALGVAGDRPVAAATVDHELQDGSAARAAATAEVLRGIGYRSVTVLTVDVVGPGGMEAAARRARYAALGRLTAGDRGAVLLGHTADDQAETVLLGLSRGSGPRSIAGMRPWREPWGRPLLGLRRADTEAACAAAGLTPWHDPQNDDPAFTRVRLRRQVLPLLEDVLGGGITPALARTAELMADDLAALDVIAAGVLSRARSADPVPGTGRAVEDPDSLSIGALAGVPAAIRRRVLRRWAGGEGRQLDSAHLHRLDDLVTRGRGGAAVRLPGGSDVVREGTVLKLINR